MKVFNEDCLEYLKRSKDIFDLSIIDPPYFRILKSSKWDNFKNYEEYLSWCEQWVVEIIKHMRYSGTIVLYGCTRNFNVLCDLNNLFIKNGCYFVEEIVIDKGIKSMAGRISDKIKMCPPVSENILVYRKDAKPYVKELLLESVDKSKLSVNEIKEYMEFPKNGGGNWTKYCGNTEFPQLPTKEHWEKLSKLLGIDLEYVKIEEVYNGIIGLTNVWSDIDFGKKQKRTNHPSEKPLELSKRLVKLFTNESNNVFIPFMGSGSEVLACKLLHREVVGCEKDKGYFDEYIKPIEIEK